MVAVVLATGVLLGLGRRHRPTGVSLAVAIVVLAAYSPATPGARRVGRRPRSGIRALVLFAAALAPTVIPQIARRFTGLSADSPEFPEAYAEQPGRLIEHPAPSRPHS